MVLTVFQSNIAGQRITLVSITTVRDDGPFIYCQWWDRDRLSEIWTSEKYWKQSLLHCSC